jgi:hypothetical protein
VQLSQRCRTPQKLFFLSAASAHCAACEQFKEDGFVAHNFSVHLVHGIIAGVATATDHDNTIARRAFNFAATTAIGVNFIASVFA